MASYFFGDLQNAVAITPDDNVDIDPPPAALYIGSNGSLSVVTMGGNVLNIAGMVVGGVLPLKVKRVRATGTTITGILGLYR